MSTHPRQKRWDAAGEVLIALGTLNALYGCYETLVAHPSLAGVLTIIILLVPSMVAIVTLWLFFRWRRKKEKKEMP